MKRIVIVSDSRHISKVRTFLKNTTIIATNLEVERHLQKEGITFKPLQGYIKLKNHNDLFCESKEFIRQWIKQNQNFNNQLNYENIHLFDLLSLYFSAINKNLYSIEDIIQTIDILKRVIEKEDPYEIIAVDDNSLTTELLKNMNKKLNLIKSKKIINFKRKILIPYAAKQIIKLKVLKGYLKNKIKRNIPKKGKIILFASGQIYINSLFSLIKSFKNDILIIKPLQIRYDSVTNLLKKKQIPFTEMESFLDSKIVSLANHYSKKLRKNLEILFENKDFRSSFIYKGIPIFNVLKELFRYFLKRRNKFFEAIINIELNKKILKEVNPKLVVLIEEDNLLSKSMVLLAKSQNVKTLCVQHGYSVKPLIKEPILSDKVFVWGDIIKKETIKYNKNKKNDVFVTGKLLEKKDYKKEITLKKLKIPLNKKIVMLVPTNLPDTENALHILGTLEAIKDLSDIQLVIKPYPGRDVKLPKRLVRLMDTKPIVVKEINLNEIISASDLIITYFSTVGLDAMYYSKPVIIVNFTGKPNELDYVSSGAAVGVNNIKDLKETIKLLLFNKKEKEKLLKKTKLFVRERIFDNEKGLQRAIKVINDIIN